MTLPTWLLALAGAAGGAGAAKLIDKAVSKPDSVAVEATRKLDEEIRLKEGVTISVLDTGERRIATSQVSELLAKPNLNLRAYIVEDPYAGWLGSLITYGHQVQMAYINYLSSKHHGSAIDVGTGYGISYVIPVNSDLFIFKFAEFPPPLRKLNCNIVTNAPSDDDIYLSHERKWVYKQPLEVSYLFAPPRSENDDRGPVSAYQTTKEKCSWLATTSAYQGFNFDRYPSKPDWVNERDYNKILFEDRYANQVRNYYYGARWIVWAAEMWRIHSKYNDYVPPREWREYCVQWGIGCARSDRCRDKWTFNKGVQINNRSVKLKPPKTAIPTGELLRRVMTRIPVPGSIPIGSEFNRLANWPGSSGALAPGYSWGDG